MAARSRHLCSFVVLAVGVGYATTMCALPSSAAAQQMGDEERRARQLSYEGEQAYAEGRFEEAALLIRRAYSLFEEPLLQHNLGRALESLGDEEGAVEAYQRYLRDVPDADNRAHVEGRLATLRAEIAEDEARASASVATVAPTPPEDDSDSGGLSAGPFIVGGLGVATLVGAAATGFIALGKQTDARQEPVQERAREILDEGETLALATNILLVTGSALLVAAVIWWVLDLSGDAEDAPVEVGLGLGSIAIAGRFD